MHVADTFKMFDVDNNLTMDEFEFRVAMRGVYLLYVTLSNLMTKPSGNAGSDDFFSLDCVHVNSKTMPGLGLGVSQQKAHRRDVSSSICTHRRTHSHTLKHTHKETHRFNTSDKHTHSLSLTHTQPVPITG